LSFVRPECENPPLKKVSFVTLWLPQAQSAGFYVAHDKGIYEKYGLDVDMLDGGPDRPPFRFLKEGKVDFTVLWLSTAIEKRSQGIDLVNIAQIFQRSGLMLVAKKSSGINKPEDMEGKKVGLWDAEFEIQPRAFFKKYKLNVKVVTQSYSVNLFLRDGVDVASAMYYNEYHTILNSGYDPEDLSAFFFYEHGLNAPEDGIYAMAETYKKDPAMCEAFANASIEGWQYAFNHVEEAVGIVLKYMEKAHIPANRTHQRWMLEKIKDLVMTKDKHDIVGILNEEDYNKVSANMTETGLIDNVPMFTEFNRSAIKKND